MFTQVEAGKGGLREKGHGVGTGVVTWVSTVRGGLPAEECEESARTGRTGKDYCSS